LKLAAEVVKRETGQGKAHYFGTSSGAIRAAAYAQAPARPGRPAGAERLHLQGATARPTLADRAKQVE